MEGLALTIYNIAREAARAEWGQEIAELRDEVHTLSRRLRRHQEQRLIADIFGQDTEHSVKA